MTDRFSSDLPGVQPRRGSGQQSSRLPHDSQSRVFRLGGEWYFSTRDGEIGPFRTREQARREAEAHRAVLKPG